MRSWIWGLSVVLAAAGAVIADGASRSSRDSLLWAVAYADFLLAGYVMGWLLARLTPGWEPSAFVWKWCDFFRRPDDREMIDG